MQVVNRRRAADRSPRARGDPAAANRNAQNDIIKLFSVLAVIFMPPTVIASIYGMNFKNMPELEWRYGYPFAIVVMICAAVLPYLFFRWKKWL